MSRRLLFATTNLGKLAELQALVGDGVQVVSLEAFAGVDAPDEDQPTFEGNARKKAHHYARATGLAALADDSGLCVDALGGAPGVHSARYAPGTDRHRYEKLLEAMRDVPDAERTAAFHCVLCLATPDGAEQLASGECPGVIARAARGTNGFGYDPVFLLPDAGRTMAELTREEKAQRSHRGRAFAQLARTLTAYARGEWPAAPSRAR